MIIGLTGKKRHGKSYFCEFLAKKLKHPRHINFKDPLISMAIDIGWDGEKDEKGRRLLQLLGTDVVRECIDQDYWVKKWEEKATFINEKYGNHILIDDVRFNNEAQAVITLGGMIVKVITPEIDDSDNHPSEQGIDLNYVKHTYVLDFGLEHIHAAVEEFCVTYKI